MKRHEVELLYSYFYNNLCRLENEVKQLQFNIRFRAIDSSDCLELLVATVQLETFREAVRQIILLLNIKNGGGYIVYYQWTCNFFMDDV